MKFSTAIVAAFAALVSAQTGVYNHNVTYVTEVIPEYVTYCPGPTVLNFANKKVTVTAATTLTIKDCVVVKPVIVTAHVECDECKTKGYVPEAVPTGSYTPGVPAVPVVPGAPQATGGYVAPSGSYVPTGSYIPTSTQAVTAGASKAMAVSGAGLAGVLALALAL
ncbi:Clock-controlled protein 6 [Ceratocystis fimbriata CBS 114723]|uniref:Clock-controlled protein 6 n=1 Tax=Ceratocystis fimbriata CBS 114723 TaxID=1035309 RepID=A0A2C5XA65_9PEZI|nr:Clock-controlled protein 6 [Ceratocystis fimbriata CBS 114723]